MTIQGGNFNDDTEAGGGAYSSAGGASFNLDNPVSTNETAGIASGQTLTIEDNGADNYATSFTDDGIIDLVTTPGNNADLENQVSSNAITVASGAAIDTSIAAGQTCYVGYGGTLDIDSGGSFTVGGAGTTDFYGSVAVTDSGTVTADSGATLDTNSTSFTNAGSIVNNGTFNENTDFNITTGTESGTNPVTIQGGNFNDDTEAGGGAYSSAGGGGFNLDNPVSTNETAGIASGQTLTIEDNGADNWATSFTDDGTIDLVTTPGNNADLANQTGSDAITVASGAAIDTSVAAGQSVDVGYGGTLDIDSGGSFTVGGAGTTVFYGSVVVTNNGTLTVADGSNLSIGVDFIQGEFGTLAVTSDPQAGTKSTVTGGTDTLDGTLDVTTDGTPTAYSAISSASSIAGYFGTLNYHGISYATSYSSSAVTLTPTSAYSLAGLTLSSTSVNATGVAYTVDLTGQAITAGSTTFTVTAPAGTTFPSYSSNCSAVTFEDVTTSTSDPCLAATPVTGGGGTTLTFTAPISIPANQEAQIQILDVTNSGPASATDYLTVNNGSVSVQLGYALTPPTSVSNASIAASSTSDGASDVVYSTTFTATNGLTADGYSNVTLTFPSTYTAPTYTSNCNQVIIYDLTADTSETCSTATPGTSGHTVTYAVPLAISPGDQVKIVWTGVSNPASSTGTQTFTLATTADPTPVDLSVVLTAPTAVTNGTISATSTSDSATKVLYTSTFKSVNELVGGYSTITLTLPSGYTAPTYSTNCNVAVIDDETTSTSETCESADPTVSGQSITIQVPASVTVNPGDVVQVQWYGLSNPASATGAQTFQLHTSADPTPVNLPVTLTTETGVTGLAISPSTGTAGATGVTYTATFVSKNGLVTDNGENSAISVTFPAGTVLGTPAQCGEIAIDDTTSGQSETCSTATPTLSNGGLTVTYLVPINVSDGDHIQLTITGVTNPSPTSCSGSQSASLLTTSDPASESASYAIAGVPGAPTLAAPTGAGGKDNLSWTAPTCTGGSPIISYTILRGTSTGSETTLTTGVTGTTYQDTPVTNGRTYYYEVEAVNAQGPSLPSNEESVTPEPIPESTTTALTPTIASSTTYGSETTETFAGTVTGQSGDGNPQGTVTVYYGTPTQTQLCQSTLTASGSDAATYSCSLTASQLSAGSYTNVVAVYGAGASSNANYTYTTSTSTPVQSFTVSPAAEGTTTALTPTIASSTTFGSETTETFAGTVTGASGEGNPEGTVTVYYGTPTQTQLCQSTLTASGSDAATYSCSLTASQLSAGSYTNVVATYAPGTPSSSGTNYTYTTSTSSPVQSFTVNAAAKGTVTALTPTIASSTTFGSETTETFAGTVTGASGEGNPEGTVTLYFGTPTQTELCQSALTASGSDAATYSCSLTASQLATGTYSSVVAVYAPGTPSSSSTNYSYTTSTSTPAQSFTVNPATATPESTTTALTPTIASSTTYGSETTETFAGTVTGQSGDGNPEGTVTLYFGTPTQTELCQNTLTASGSDAATFSCSLTASQLSAGSYTNVVAVYGAGASSNASFSYTTSTSSPAQSFTVNAAAESTVTALTPTIASSTTYGSETTETFAGTVTGQSGDGNPQGTVTVYYGTPTQTQLCQSTLTASGSDAATYSCSLTASQLSAGSYTNVVAVYGAGASSNANYTYTTSTSTPVQSFTVSPAAEGTTTALTPTIASSTTFGSETTETFAGTVTGASGEGNPEGTVTVYYGTPTQTQLCQSTLTASGSDAATYSCSLTASQLSAGSYTNVVATYAPGTPSSSGTNYTYTTSTSSPVQSFTVNAAAKGTVTALTPTIASSTTFGSETTETFAGTVTGASGEGNPEGTVTLYFGTPTQTELCQSALTASGSDAATYSCSLTASQLATGTYSSVVAVYAPGTPSSSSTNYSYTTSTSTPAQSFTVNPATATPESTTTALTPTIASSTTYGSETTETFAGTVTGQSGDGNPEGTVTLYFGTPTQTELCQNTLTASGSDAATFSCSLTASQLSAGSYTNVVAVYGAGASSNASFSYTTSTSSPAQSFTVHPESKGTTTVLNTVTSPITSGSETAETFNGTVTGASGDGYPEGTVAIYEGTTPVQLCSETLPTGGGDSAGFSCSLTASQLGTGTYSSVDAVYTPGSTSSSSPNFTYTGSTSTPAQSFTVNPATTSANNLRIQLSSPALVSGIGGLYLITVTNLAATPTTGTLTITDVLPSGLSYDGTLVYPPGFRCSATGGKVTCTDTTAIAAHGVDDLLLVVGVSARSGTSITNTVTLAPVGTPASNYTASVKTTVSGR